MQFKIVHRNVVCPAQPTPVDPLNLVRVPPIVTPLKLGGRPTKSSGVHEVFAAQVLDSRLDKLGIWTLETKRRTICV